MFYIIAILLVLGIFVYVLFREYAKVEELNYNDKSNEQWVKSTKRENNEKSIRLGIEISVIKFFKGVVFYGRAWYNTP